MRTLRRAPHTARSARMHDARIVLEYSTLREYRNVVATARSCSTRAGECLCLCMRARACVRACACGCVRVRVRVRAGACVGWAVKRLDVWQEISLALSQTDERGENDSHGVEIGYRCRAGRHAHICVGTRHICAGTGLIAATSAPGRGPCCTTLVRCCTTLVPCCTTLIPPLYHPCTVL